MSTDLLVTLVRNGETKAHPIRKAYYLKRIIWDE